MCFTIAPDCNDSAYVSGGSLNIYRGNDYNLSNENTTQRSTTIIIGDNSDNVNIGIHRFPDLNETSNLWAVAGREITTVKPNWQITTYSSGYAQQYSTSTDYGKKKFCEY